MPQSDRNNGLFHCLRQAGDGEVHHGKQTGRQARTVKRGYLREASHEPRQQAMAPTSRYGPCVNDVLLCTTHSACIRGQAVPTCCNYWFDVRKNKVWRHVFIVFWRKSTPLKNGLLSTKHIFICSALFQDSHKLNELIAVTVFVHFIAKILLMQHFKRMFS